MDRRTQKTRRAGQASGAVRICGQAGKSNTGYDRKRQDDKGPGTDYRADGCHGIEQPGLYQSDPENYGEIREVLKLD